MSGFAAEISKAKAASPSLSVPPPSTPSQSVESTDTVPTTTPDATFDMPAHGESHPEQAEQVAQPAQAEPQPKQGKIRIGNEFFDSHEDALAYAQDLQLSLAQKDAVEQYRNSQEQQRTKEEVKEVDPFEGLDQILFEDPKKGARLIYEKAIADAQKAFDEKQAQAQKEREEAQARHEAEESAWAQFSGNNQDLANNRDVVQYIIEKNIAEISKVPMAQREKFIADKTRAFLGSRYESTLPSKELQNKNVSQPMGSNSATSQTPAQNKSEALDFISQVRKHTKRPER
jgi:hypothetical protein